MTENKTSATPKSQSAITLSEKRAYAYEARLAAYRAIQDYYCTFRAKPIFEIVVSDMMLLLGITLDDREEVRICEEVASAVLGRFDYSNYYAGKQFVLFRQVGDQFI